MLANHHCNFDNWNSKYQPWNSVAVGPKKEQNEAEKHDRVEQRQRDNVADEQTPVRSEWPVAEDAERRGESQLRRVARTEQYLDARDRPRPPRRSFALVCSRVVVRGRRHPSSIHGASSPW